MKKKRLIFWQCLRRGVKLGVAVVFVGFILHREAVDLLTPLHCARDRITVYSDVDDTLQCSAQHHHAGVDMQFPKGTIYPGAVAFQLALSRGLFNKQALPVVLLSARPKVLKWILGIKHSHPIAQAFRAQEARFEERFPAHEDLGEAADIELEDTEDIDSVADGEGASSGTEDDFYEYGDEYWDGDEQEPMVVEVKQASSYHDEVVDHQLEVRADSSARLASNRTAAHKDESAEPETPNDCELEEHNDEGVPNDRANSAIESAGGGEGSYADCAGCDLEIIDVSEEDNDSTVDDNDDDDHGNGDDERERPLQATPANPASALVPTDAPPNGICPWNGGAWGYLSTGRMADADRFDDVADNYYTDKGIQRSDGVVVGSGGFLQEQGDGDDAHGTCPWLDADGRPVIRNSGWRRRSRKALLQYLPLQPIMPLQPFLQFLPLGMLMDAGNSEGTADGGDEEDLSGHGDGIDDSEAASNMGVDIKRNLYGNLYDFLHNTRSRYVAIGRTKLDNVIHELEREEELVRYNNQQRTGDVDDPRRGRCVAFVGDSGQGDEIVGRALVGNPGSYEDPVVPRSIVDRIAHVFIHDVQAPSNDAFTTGFSPPEGLPRYVRFKSYAEAALVAFKNCRISVEGLSDVVDSIERSTQFQMCAESEAQAPGAAFASDGTGNSGQEFGEEHDGVSDEKRSASNEPQAQAPRRGADESFGNPTTSEPCGRGASDLCCARLQDGVAMARYILDSSARLMWTRGRCSALTAFEGALQDAAELSGTAYENWKHLGTGIVHELNAAVWGEGGYARRAARQARNAFATGAQLLGFEGMEIEAVGSSELAAAHPPSHPVEQKAMVQIVSAKEIAARVARPIVNAISSMW